MAAQEPDVVHSAELRTRVYELLRGSSGYGFTLSGECPSVVTSIIAGSPAEETGLLPGLLLLDVDGVDVSRARHEEVVELVARSRGSVRLVCSEGVIEVNELVSDERSSSAGKMNEHALVSRKMSSPSSEESFSLSQALDGPFIPAEGAKNESGSRVFKQRQSLMLALEAGQGKERVKRPRAKDADEKASSEDPQTKVEDRREILKLGYAMLRFPVSYFGSVQVVTTKPTPQASVETIRRCVARVQAEGRCAPVTLEATSAGVSLINPHGRLLIDMPAPHLAYSGICIDDARFFAIVTRRPKRYERGVSSRHRHPVCHVFMVEGPRKSASQDGLNQSAEGTSHVLKSIASILRTSKHEKALQLQDEAKEHTNTDPRESGSSEYRQSGVRPSRVYAIGRTASVDCILEQKLPNQWTGTSDPDLLSTEKRRRSFDGMAFSSLSTGVDMLGRPTDHLCDLSNGIDKQQLEFKDVPPDDYPEEWEVSNQHFVANLPPPPPEILEPPPIMQEEGHVQYRRQQAELPRQSGLDGSKVEMSSQHRCNTDQSTGHHHVLKEQLVQEGSPPPPPPSSPPPQHERLHKWLPDFFYEVFQAELQPSNAIKLHTDTIDASSKEKETVHRLPSDNHTCEVTKDTGGQQQDQGVKGGASFGLEEPPLPTDNEGHNHVFSNMQQDGNLLSTSMDSLALMSTVGSEYSVRDDIGRIASWALSLTRLLKDPEGVACLKEFMRSEHSDENLLFWLECQEFAESKDPTVAQVRSIYGKFLSPTAPTPVNIDYHTIQRVAENMDFPQKDMFTKAQREVFRLMKMDCHPRFVRSTLYQQCVVAEMEGLPLPIDPPSPRAKPNTTKTKETKKVKVRSSSLVISDDREGAAGSTPAQAQSNSSISSGYSSPGEERRKKEKKKSVLWSWRKNKKLRSNEDLDEEPEGRSSTATEGSEEARVDESKGLFDVCGVVNEQMFRAILPDSSSTIVVAKHGHTVREALENLFERRNLEFGLLDVVIQSNGEVVPYEAPVSCLYNKEVRLQRAGLTFKAAFPDAGLVTVKVNKKKTIREVLCGVMAERGLQIDSYVVHLDNCPVPLQLDITSSLLANQSVIIKPATQLICGSYEDECRVEKSPSPDRGYQSERTSSSLSTQSERSGAFKFRLRIPGLRRSTDMELEARKQELRRVAKDMSAISQREALVPPGPSKREKDQGEETKKMGKNRKGSKKKGKEERIRKEKINQEAENGLMRPVPSTEDLISLLNRVQCDRLDDQRTGLPEPGPLPDLLMERTHSQAEIPNGDVEVPPSARSSQASTLPRSAKGVQQRRSPTNVTFSDDVGKPEAPFIRPPDVPPDTTWLPHQGNEQSLSVPDLCPVDDPTFTDPPDITDVHVNSTPIPNGRSNDTPSSNWPTDYDYFRHRQRDRHPIFATPILHQPSRSSHRYTDGSTDRSRVNRNERLGRSNKASSQRRTVQSQRGFEWMPAIPRDRLAGENSLDSSAMSETSVTFV